MTRRVLSPYGIEPKKLKQHLIDIGFTKTNIKKEEIELDISFINYKIKEEKIIMTPQNIEDLYNYDNDDFNTKLWPKYGLQVQIDYPYSMCLIDPFDDGNINYDEICKEIDEKKQYNNEESDEEYNDNYNDYSYRKKCYY